MAITLTSMSESPEALAEALASRGYTPDKGESDHQSEAVGDVKNPSDPSKASPGESPSGAEDGKLAPAITEAGDKPQEKTEAKQPKEAEPKPEAKFEPRRKQLERQVARLHEDLDLERGSKAALAKKLEDLESQLSALKPAEAVKPVDNTPAKPKRPTLAQFEFDQDQYDLALNKYDDDLGAYHAALAAKTVNETMAQRDREATERQQKAEADRIMSEFETRRNEQAAEIEGYQELLEEAGDFKVPDLVELAIIQSEIPALMLHFFTKDRVENDGKELARIEKLDPIGQTREMAKLEVRLANERETSKKPKKTVAKETAPVVEETPAPVAADKTPEAPPKPKAVPEAPIEPLGSRTTGRTPQLGEAKNIKEYMALRAQNVQH